MLGPRVPPNMAALHWHAIQLGMKAAGSAALIVGVALLFANNPRRDRPQLPYRRLAGVLGFVFLCCVFFAAVFGLIGRLGGLTWTSDDLQMLARDNLFRPQRFLCVFGIHLGGYVGGVAGTLLGIVWVIRGRPAARSAASLDRSRIEPTST